MSGDDYKQWLALGHKDADDVNACAECGLSFELFQEQEHRRSCWQVKLSDWEVRDAKKQFAKLLEGR